MNNGQPPYGDPSAWGQQGNQANPAQYPVQPNAYAQPGNYPPQQSAYPQQPYPQQPYPQQPYPQQMQQDGQQGYQQGYEAVPTYGQQQHPQQQAYAQQNWQPYGYDAQQPANPQMGYGPQPQGYFGQPGYPPQQPQQTYPQFNQMGQPVQQGYGNGYSGFYSQPQEKRFEIPLDVIGKVILFGVLPVLFILAMIFGTAALKWLFLAGAVGGIILMWMREIVTPNMRLTLSLVLGVMAVVALVGALNGAPRDVQNTPSNVNQAPSATTGTPTAVPTNTPSPEDAPDSAVEQLMSFFYFWSQNQSDEMLARTAPSWRESVDDPERALFIQLLHRTPQSDYEVTSITGTEEDALRTATVKVTIDNKDGRTKLDRYSFKILMKKEDGVWYVDPQSLASNEKETASETTAAANNTPTQPPLYTGTPSTVLYYNANGGVMYHLDPDCPDVGAKYKPMTSFMYIDLDKAPYSSLRPCTRCGAPIPDDD